jgi:hypothetical protein
MQFPSNQSCCSSNPSVTGWGYSGCGNQYPVVPGTNPALQTWNGQNFVVADGSAQNRISLPFLQVNGGAATYVVGADNNGAWSYYSPNLSPNLSGGSAGQVPWQSAPSVTAFTATGTSGQLLQSGGTGSPTWIAPNNLPVTATGSTTARTLSNRFADVVNVKDFGAVGDGVTDDTAAIQAAVNAITTAGTIYVPDPSVSYNLVSNVISGNRAISWIFDGGVVFSGAGLIVPSNTFGFYYDNDIKNTNVVIQKGTATTPIAGANAASLVVKYSNQASDGPNPTTAAIAYKYASAANSRVSAVFGEAQDMVGGVGTFVEGGRFHGINVTNNLKGSTYGVTALAQSGDGIAGQNPNSNFVIGTESEVIDFGADAPVPRNFSNASFSANFLSTCRAGNKPDAAFLVNPYNTIPVQTGFMIAPATGGAKAVNLVAFGCYQTGLVYGLDLGKGSYSFSAISIPNNTAITAMNAAGTTELNIAYLNSSNNLVLGGAVASTLVSAPTGGGFFNNVGTNTSGWHVGSVNPNGNIAALIGSIYSNVAGGVGNTLWVKTSGAGTNTGWSATAT